MAAINDTSWIDANLEVIENYLQKEFENFSVAHRADPPLTHIFIVNDGKKRFTLFIEQPILADRTLTPARMTRLLEEHVAGEMRLHGKAGYHWEPANGAETSRDGN